MSLLFQVDIPQNSMVDQQKLQISELHFDKFPTPSTFSCWKIRFKTQVSACSDFLLEATLTIKVEMVDSVDDFLNDRAQFRVVLISECRDAECEDCVCFEQDHPEFPVQEEGKM